MPNSKPNNIELPGSTVSQEWLDNVVPSCQQSQWHQANYVRRDALFTLDRSRAQPYTGQAFDPEQEQLVEKGWTHDHCLICLWDLGEDADPKHGVGYTNGQGWLCSECYARFIQPHAI